mgnify:CR=1 FL=1
MFSDGGARNNPGPSGIGVVVYKDEQKVLELAEYLGEQTNNWAEYQGVIRGLEKLIEQGLQEEQVEVRMDSKLVVEQLLGHWKIKEPGLQEQARRAKILMQSFPALDFTHIPREKNKEADRLVNLAIDRALGKGKFN